jgi:hypothetical protein
MAFAAFRARIGIKLLISITGLYSLGQIVRSAVRPGHTFSEINRFLKRRKRIYKVFKNDSPETLSPN